MIISHPFRPDILVLFLGKRIQTSGSCEVRISPFLLLKKSFQTIVPTRRQLAPRSPRLEHLKGVVGHQECSYAGLSSQTSRGYDMGTNRFERETEDDKIILKTILNYREHKEAKSPPKMS